MRCNSPSPALPLLLSLLACASEPLGAGEEGSIGEGVSSASALSVASAVSSRCSTTSVFGLSEQLVQELSCMEPGILASIDLPGVENGPAVFPYLQADAARALERAASRRAGPIFINSALRTLPQQYLLYRWFQEGRCGIRLAARPGQSNHQSGLAVDVSSNASWRSALGAEGYRWFGPADRVHFDFTRGRDLRRLSTLAFQRLWNRNHPGDRIAEDGDYGPTTESRLRRSPGEGFPVGASCGLNAIAPINATPIEVYWQRQADGRYDLRALAPPEIQRVAYLVDNNKIAEVTRADGENFPASYRFHEERRERLFEVVGFDAAGSRVGLGVALLDVTAGVGAYIRQMGGALYEIGLERAPEGVHSVEVVVDGRYTLTDTVTGTARSARGAVRASFSTLGTRSFAIRTYNADGSLRGTLHRTFRLR